MDMDRGVRGWIYNVSKQNFWRVAGWYEFEDLIQDGFMNYQRIVNKYPGKTPAHTAALFRTAFTNHIHDLAKKRTRYSPEVIESDYGLSLELIETPAYVLPASSEIIASLPLVLKRLLHVMETEPHRVRSRCRVMPEYRQTTNDKLCRLVGADPSKIDLLSVLYDYLAGDTRSPAV